MSLTPPLTFRIVPADSTFRCSAPCPYCGAAIHASPHAWEQEEDGSWVATELQIDCQHEPAMDDPEWKNWSQRHGHQDSGDAYHALHDRMVRALKRGFRFTMESEEPTPEPANPKPLRVLRLTLKRKWFRMIASGEKREEYRKPGQWIKSRLCGKTYDVVEFKNGYGSAAPTVTVEFKGWRVGHGHADWGAQPETHYIIIELGRVLSPNAPAVATAPKDSD